MRHVASEESLIFASGIEFVPESPARDEASVAEVVHSTIKTYGGLPSRTPRRGGASGEYPRGSVPGQHGLCFTERRERRWVILSTDEVRHRARSWHVNDWWSNDTVLGVWGGMDLRGGSVGGMRCLDARSTMVDGRCITGNPSVGTATGRFASHMFIP